MDGSEATETVSFALDGTPYEIDLSARNAGKMRAEVGPYLDHARSLGRMAAVAAVGRRTRSTEAGGASTTGTIREWLNSNGYQGDLKERGRIPASLRALFESRTPKAESDDPIAFIDEAVAAITDEHVEERLNETLRQAGYAPTDTAPALTLLPPAEPDPTPPADQGVVVLADRPKRARMPRATTAGDPAAVSTTAETKGKKKTTTEG